MTVALLFENLSRLDAMEWGARLNEPNKSGIAYTLSMQSKQCRYKHTEIDLLHIYIYQCKVIWKATFR